MRRHNPDRLRRSRHAVTAQVVVDADVALAVEAMRSREGCAEPAHQTLVRLARAALEDWIGTLRAEGERLRLAAEVESKRARLALAVQEAAQLRLELEEMDVVHLEDVAGEDEGDPE